MERVLEFLPIYIRQSNNIRYWAVRIEKKLGNPVTITTFFGLVGSPIQVKEREIFKGKNLGKSNETTPFEQAVSEIEYEQAAKIRKGYTRVDSIAERSIDWHMELWRSGNIAFFDNLPEEKVVNDVPRVMKLHHARLPEYEKGSDIWKKTKDVKFPVLVQPKKDGVCACISSKFGIRTRDGKDRLSPKGEAWEDITPHIITQIEQLPDDLIFNGEMFLENSNLQEITSANQKYHTGKSDNMVVWLFDIVDTKLSALDRYYKLIVLQSTIELYGLEHIKVIPGYICYDWDQVFDVEDKHLQEGEEGIVLRNLQGKYAIGKRSSDVLKLVRLDRSEILITDIIAMENEPSHGLFICKAANGEYFKVTPSFFTHEQRKALLEEKNDHIGHWLTIQHRGYTNDGIPRIAKALSIRYDNR